MIPAQDRERRTVHRQIDRDIRSLIFTLSTRARGLPAPKTLGARFANSPIAASFGAFATVGTPQSLRLFSSKRGPSAGIWQSFFVPAFFDLERRSIFFNPTRPGQSDPPLTPLQVELLNNGFDRESWPLTKSR